MAVFNEPTKWAQTLGKDADVTTIPNTAGDTDPSIDKIFPSVFSIPLAQGGRAIPRSVLNGLFKLLGDWCFYQQNGGVASYSSAFDYAVGSFVKYNNQLYICTQANGASSSVKAPTDTAYWAALPTNPVNSDLVFNNALRIMRKDTDKYIIIEAGDDSTTASSVTISGVNRTGQEGTITLIAKDSNNNSSIVTLFPDGTFTHNGNKIITQPDINSKANTDFSNVTTTASILMAHNAMPSGTFDTLTLGASGTHYTAPADGYFAFSAGSSSTANTNFVGLDNITTKIRSRCSIVQGAYAMWAYIPCAKGDDVAVSYSGFTDGFLFFVYAIGSVSEQGA